MLVISVNFFPEEPGEGMEGPFEGEGAEFAYSIGQGLVGEGGDGGGEGVAGSGVGLLGAGAELVQG